MKNFYGGIEFSVFCHVESNAFTPCIVIYILMPLLAATSSTSITLRRPFWPIEWARLCRFLPWMSWPVRISFHAQQQKEHRCRFRSRILISQDHFRITICKGWNKSVFWVLMRKRLGGFCWISRYTALVVKIRNLNLSCLSCWGWKNNRNDIHGEKTAASGPFFGPEGSP